MFTRLLRLILYTDIEMPAAATLMPRDARPIRGVHMTNRRIVAALLILAGPMLSACTESTPSSPPEQVAPRRPSQDVLDAVVATGATGPVLAAQAVYLDGRVNTLAAAPGVIAHRDEESASFSQIQLSPQDAPPEALFFIQNPGDGTYAMSDGTPVFYTEHRPDGVTGIFHFFCIVDNVPFQLMEVTVDSITQARAPDTGGHIDAEHAGQDSIGGWHSFDPPDGVVRNGLFQARYNTNEVSQDEDLSMLML